MFGPQPYVCLRDLVLQKAVTGSMSHLQAMSMMLGKMLRTLGVPDESFSAYWRRLSSRTVALLKVCVCVCEIYRMCCFNWLNLSGTPNGCTPRLNMLHLQNGVYRTIGTMMSTIIVQGGEPPALLSPSVVDYIVWGHPSSSRDTWWYRWPWFKGEP